MITICTLRVEALHILPLIKILVHAESTSNDPDLSQDIFSANTWSTWNHHSPYLLLKTIVFWQKAPIRAVLRLEPFEIINLVPLIPDQVVGYRDLHSIEESARI
jgi:hypothetical protein